MLLPAVEETTKLLPNAYAMWTAHSRWMSALLFIVGTDEIFTVGPMIIEFVY